MIVFILLLSCIHLDQMFTRIVLDNFKSLGHIDFDLMGANNNPLRYAVIYGENGSGKTNLMESIGFLKSSITTRSLMHYYEEFRNRIDGTLLNDDELAQFEKEFDSIKMSMFDIMKGAIKQQNFNNERLKFKMKGSDGDMILDYHFIIDGKKSSYSLRIDNNGEIVEESYKTVIGRRIESLINILKIDQRLRFRYNDGLFMDRSFEDEMNENVRKYWGKHSFLALLEEQYHFKTDNYMKTAIIEQMDRLLRYIKTIRTGNIEDDFEKDPLPDLIRGSVPADRKRLLLSYEEALNKFFVRLYSDIKRVYYEITESDGKLRYELYVSKMINNKKTEIPFKDESSGTINLLDIFPSLVACAGGEVAFIDEIDTGIHDNLMTALMEQILPDIRGQLIFTTHNTSLMKHTGPRNTFILSVDRHGCKEIRSISRIATTQKNHNNQRRYEDGFFGGIPYISMLDIQEISDSLKQGER